MLKNATRAIFVKLDLLPLEEVERASLAIIAQLGHLIRFKYLLVHFQMMARSFQFFVFQGRMQQRRAQKSASLVLLDIHVRVMVLMFPKFVSLALIGAMLTPYRVSCVLLEHFLLLVVGQIYRVVCRALQDVYAEAKARLIYSILMLVTGAIYVQLPPIEVITATQNAQLDMCVILGQHLMLSSQVSAIKVTIVLGGHHGFFG